jgi:hypothetical protein
MKVTSGLDFKFFGVFGFKFSGTVYHEEITGSSFTEFFTPSSVSPSATESGSKGF